MNAIKLLVLNLILVSWLNAPLLAHDGHKKKSDQDSTLTETRTDTETQAAETHEHEGVSHVEEVLHAHDESEDVMAGMSDFPHLHPLVVHFPIVLLVISVFIQLFNVVKPGKELNWIVSGMLVAGWLGAYISGSYLHPHTSGLSEQASRVLEYHDMWAEWTVYLSGFALLFQLVGQFIFRTMWMRVVVLAVVIGAATAVSLTGHYGAQLVHIEGVGPMGQFLEKHEHSH